MEPQQKLFITNIIDTMDQLKYKLIEQNRLINEFELLKNRNIELEYLKNRVENELNDLKNKWEIQEPFDTDIPDISDEKRMELEKNVKCMIKYHYSVKIADEQLNETNFLYLFDKYGQIQELGATILSKLMAILKQDKTGNNETSVVDSLGNGSGMNSKKDTRESSVNGYTTPKSVDLDNNSTKSQYGLMSYFS